MLQDGAAHFVRRDWAEVYASTETERELCREGALQLALARWDPHVPDKDRGQEGLASLTPLLGGRVLHRGLTPGVDTEGDMDDYTSSIKGRAYHARPCYRLRDLTCSVLCFT